ncbi:hypothetical protein TNCV_2733571 [Trichonephila clavipes]|nr:hypothetical protein TNCV_2733571 [Trichonephila clavipes]
MPQQRDLSESMAWCIIRNWWSKKKSSGGCRSAICNAKDYTARFENVLEAETILRNEWAACSLDVNLIQNAWD